METHGYSACLFFLRSSRELGSWLSGVLVACILLLVKDPKWGLGVGSRRMGSTHVEEQNELEGRTKRVALRAAAKNGDPCFPQPVFLGSFLFSSELKDFL